MPDRDLSGVIKAYDVRGLVPEQLDEALAREVGAALGQVLLADGPAEGSPVTSLDGSPGAVGKSPAHTVVIGMDMRPSSPGLSAAFAQGLAATGWSAIHIGLASTDQLYYAAGSLDLPGAMFTASHNPAQYNGIKLCRAGATPIGEQSGLATIRHLIENGTAAANVAGGPQPTTSIEQRDMLAAYADHLHSLVDLSGIRPLKVVIDTGNGMGGHTVPEVLSTRVEGLDIVELYFELDGTFPNHDANPLDPTTLVDLQAAVIAHGADLGLAFDGDADRCFVVDEAGQVVDPSALTALIAVNELARHPGATILYNLITSKVVPQTVRAHGGTAVRTRVGHSFIKAVMAETGAVFGGEHSGEFYFRDFWRADSGMLLAMHVLAHLGKSPPGTGFSSLVSQYLSTSRSGEINSLVEDVAAATHRVRRHYEGRDGVVIDELDGLTVTSNDTSGQWWFNVRPSNTEPVLRLNVEADDESQMTQVRDDVLRLITS